MKKSPMQARRANSLSLKAIPPAVERGVALAALGLGFASLASAQTVAGRIVDAITLEPISDASVVVRGDGAVVARGLSGRDGLFEVSLPRAGPFLISIERLGYDSTATARVDVQPGGAAWVEVRIASMAVEMPPIQVSVQHLVRKLADEGFYRRRSRAAGVFMERSDIEELHASETNQLFRRISGIRLVRTRDGAEPVSTRPTGLGRLCFPAVILNGYAVQRRRGFSIDDLVLPIDIEAIEVYRGPSETPPQWNTTPCGAIVIWTR